MKISIVMHTFNSEKFIRRVLESVKGFDEIVICDMYSTDQTITIAKEYNCKIVYHKKISYCEPARNFAIQSASNEWVLVVDSDEVVPEALRIYLYEHTQKPHCSDGIRIPRKNYFMGKFMHGDYPDHILRFFRKEKANWPPTVHSVPHIDGQVEYIPSKRKDLAFIHLINNPLEMRINKLNTYTAQEIAKRKGKKHPLFALFYAPAYRFIKAYIIKGGFRDGKAGLVNAGMDAFYKFITIAKIWESDLNNYDIDEEIT